MGCKKNNNSSNNNSNNNKNKNKDNKDNKNNNNNSNNKKKNICDKMVASCGMERTSQCALQLRARAEHMNNTNAHTTIHNPYRIAGVRSSTIYIYMYTVHCTHMNNISLYSNLISNIFQSCCAPNKPPPGIRRSSPRAAKTRLQKLPTSPKQQMPINSLGLLPPEIPSGLQTDIEGIKNSNHQGFSRGLLLCMHRHLPMPKNHLRVVRSK